LADNFIREVDEDLRRRQLEDFWHKYGRYIVGAAVLVVALTAANVGWREYRQASFNSQSEQYAAAVAKLDAGQLDEAETFLNALQDDGNQGYRFIASLQLAKQAFTAGQTEQGLDILNQLATASDIDKVLQDFAVLSIAMHNLDNSSYEDLALYLNPLITPDNPWQYLAQELLGLAAYKDGQKDMAVQLLGELSGNVDAPRAVQKRAEELLAVIR
tara:strand:+ start:656 stop:1300 length:645 start_codon:yes stop_codon:yes gene_type:complete